MSVSRPVVSVYDSDSGRVSGSCLMPSVLMSPLRPDLVRYVCTNVFKNTRQAYAVSENSGYQTSALSWGTGRAVARIPRVQGGGTHRAGQAAFGNFCRHGGMFAPTKIWRRWHRHVNLKERRHAVASALAASSLPPLVAARGHQIDKIPELPLVVDDKLHKISKTKQALASLRVLGCDADVEKAKESKKIRPGKGKSRNRRYVHRKGPLVIYKENEGIVCAFRNLPGIDLCHVDSINLTQLAPGGTLGRLIIWTKGAFNHLHRLYDKTPVNALHSNLSISAGLKDADKKGAQAATKKAATKKDAKNQDTDAINPAIIKKKNYHLPRALLANADISRLINSHEIQSALRPMKTVSTPKATQQKNPLKNHAAMARLNPIYPRLKRGATQAQIKGTRQQKINEVKKKITKANAKKNRKASKKYFANIAKEFQFKLTQE